MNGRYVGRDGTVRVARGYVRYTNFSGWDVYRTEIPLLALLVPARTSDMIESLVADGRESGQLSKWLLATVETGMMVGDPSDAIIADAYAFGARRFEARAALQEMVDGATVPQSGPFRYPSSGPDGYVERPGLDLYAAGGYVPFDHGEGVINGTAATTLEYATADSAIAQLAQQLGDDADFATFAQRAESGKKETVTTTRQMTIEVIGNADVGQARSNRNQVLFTHDLFHRSDDLGRLVQHFLGKNFQFIAINQLRLESLFFGVGNQFRAGQRFGITGA